MHADITGSTVNLPYFLGGTHWCRSVNWGAISPFVGLGWAELLITHNRVMIIMRKTHNSLVTIFRANKFPKYSYPLYLDLILQSRIYWWIKPRSCFYLIQILFSVISTLYGNRPNKLETFCVQRLLRKRIDCRRGGELVQRHSKVIQTVRTHLRFMCNFYFAEMLGFQCSWFHLYEIQVKRRNQIEEFQFCFSVWRQKRKFSV